MKSTIAFSTIAALAILTSLAASADGYVRGGYAGPSGCYKFAGIGYGFRQSDALFWAVKTMNRSENRWAAEKGYGSLRVGPIHAVYSPFWRIKTQAYVWQKVCPPR